MEIQDKLNLPVTRKAHFKDSIKNRWRLLLRCGLILLLFSLPLIICSFSKDFFLFSKVSAEEVEQKDYTNLVAFLELIYSFIILANSALFSVGLSGVLKIIKKVCWSEGVIFWSDFKCGIKENIRVTLLMCLLFGFNILLIRVLIIINLSMILISIIGFICVFIVFPFALLTIIYSSIYVLSFKQLMHNSILLFVRNYLFLFGVSLLLILLNGIDAITIPVLFTKQGVLILLLLISSIFILLLYEYLLNSFDIDINKKNHPELYRRGLY